MTDREALFSQAIDTMTVMLALMKDMLKDGREPDMKVSQVARELGLSRTTVLEEIRHKRIKARRHGAKLLRIPRAEFERLKKQRLA